MRKKLLALLMCATMVLGTAVTASAYSADDVDNAKDVIKQYDKFIAEYNETAAKKIKFTTTYVDSATNSSIMYTYGIVDDNAGVPKASDYTENVKLDPEDDKIAFKYVGKDIAKTTATIDTTAVSTNGYKQLVVNTSPTGKTAFLVAVTEGATVHTYYATVASATAGQTLTAGQFVMRETTPASGAIVASDHIATLTEYNAKKATGDAIIGSGFQDDVYGLDVDGYIPLQDTTKTVLTAYTTLTDNYYALVSKSTAVADIAEALAKGTITKDAVAVDVKFFKLGAKPVPSVNLSATATEGSFMNFYYYSASRADETVKVAADWLSRTSLKKASGVSVYLLDKNIPTVTEYFQRVGTVYKIADVVDGKFSADYLVSGTYIFDVAAATDNAGQADADKPATDTTSSPKTGDVAPIAALAVVMMGAFGAMVVASKKRA